MRISDWSSDVCSSDLVRFAWPAPNARFLPALAAADPLFIYRPAHYLKQFHARYTAVETLSRKAAAIGLNAWPELYRRMDRSEARRAGKTADSTGRSES